MKADELMIGDWVRVIPYKKNGRIYRIDYTYGKGNEYVGVIDGDFDIGLLEPIPLTPEILEKNGFTYKDVAHNIFRGVWVCNVGRCGNVFIQFTDKVAIEIHNELWEKDEKGRADLVSFCRDWCEVLFVHELQHALRLCGIEKEIEL